MRFYTTQTALRYVAITLFSIVLASCGSGSGESSIEAPDKDVAASELRLVFADYFGDAPDTSSRAQARSIPKAVVEAGNWVVDTGYGENGWGNDEWQRYDNSIDNLFTENGNLVIRAQCNTAPACGKRDGSITSAKVTSKNRINVKYGNIRARIRMPSGAGMWPAFWTLGSDIDERPWPDAGEIDIVEMHYYYSDTRTTHFSTHWAGPRYTDSNRPICASFTDAIDSAEEENCATENKTFKAEDGYAPLTDDFHVYELDWTDKAIVGKIDGIIYFSQAIDGATMEEFLKDHYMILNLAVGGTLGGPGGPTMTAADWADPNQTDMLVDWVEVWERVPPTSATLWDNEFISDLAYNRIINTAEFNGGFVKANPKSTAVTPLKGDQVLELTYSNTRSENGGGSPAEYAAAVFDFNSIDLSGFDNLVFSIDSTRFNDFDTLEVVFSSEMNQATIGTDSPSATVIGMTGNWQTYQIPLSAFAGIDMRRVTAIAFGNPRNVAGDLIAGKLFMDDIRFTRSTAECNAASSIEFDSASYNPNTTVGEIRVNDPCAKSSLARVEIENDLDAIIVGVKLDASGKGQSRFGLTGADSVCPTNDSAGILQLSGQLMASYNRSPTARGAASSAFAAAGIDPNAPGTTLESGKAFIIANDPEAAASNPRQVLAFGIDVDFNVSDFGSGASFDSSIIDPAFPEPVWAISNGAGKSAVFALFNFNAGFTSRFGEWSIGFKVKGLPGNEVIVKFGDADPDFPVDLDNSDFSTPIAGSNGWFDVQIPMSNFPGISGYNYLVIKSNTSSGADFSFLVTDIAFVEPLSNVPAECSITGGGGGNTATGGSVPEVSIYEADGSVADLSPNYDPFTSGTGIATVVDTSYAQALELTSADGYTVSLVQLGLTGLSFTGYDELLFKVKGLTADNTIVVKVEATGGGVVNVDITNPAANVTTEDLGDGWTQVIMSLSAFGDVSSSSQIVFQTLDNAYAVGEKILLTDIGFNNAGGGGGGGSGLQLDVNGGFEAGDGDLSDWIVVPNGGTIAAVDTQNSGSVWSVNLAADGSGGSPFISLAGLGATDVKPGDNVYVSFDMCGTLEGDGGAVKIALLSEKGDGNGSDRATLEEFLGSSPPASVWTRYEYTTQASANVTDGVSLQLEAACGAVAGCGVNVYFDNVSIILGGDLPTSQTASGESCAAPPVPGVMLPIDFEDGPYVFGDFNGGQASVETNSQSSGINTSANVGKMLKFADQIYGGSTLDLGGTLNVPTNSAFTMKVWSSREVPVLFKLEGGPAAEVEVIHSGGSAWEELTFDFTGQTTGDHTAITLIFDNGTNGAAATDPGNWTFYFDDIDFAPEPPPANVTLFADAFAPGWGGFLDANGTVTVVTDSDSTYGEVLEITTSGSTVVGIGSRADIPGADGSTIDTSRFAVLEFDLKLVAAPTSGTDIWRLKVENPGVEIGIGAPVLGTWIRYSIPISDLGTPNALELIMLFADYVANAGAVYRLDNVKLLEEASPPPPEDITLFADALAPGWGGFLDANGTVAVVTDSDSTYGEVLELTTSGSTVVGIGSRADIPGADGSTIDTSDYATLEFDLKLVTAPTSGTTNWRLKVENPGVEIGIDAPVLGTWVHYSIPISSLGTPAGLELIMLFPDYGANAGAVYRLDNVALLVKAPGGGGGGGSPGDELVANGDFETNGLENWLTFANGGTVATDNVEVSPNLGSTVSVKLVSGPGNNPVLKQERFAASSLTANASVTVEFDIFGTLGTGSVLSIQLITEGSTVAVEDLVPQNSDWESGWANYSFTTNVGSDISGGISLQFVAIGGAGTMTLNVDNVSIVLN